MNDFAGMEEILEDFMLEAGDMLSTVDSKLIALERSPTDKELLNVIFRGFHTIKGGAGFLNAAHLVEVCHLTENLFDKLRTGALSINAALMDVIFSATGEVRKMFEFLEQRKQPEAAPPDMISSLQAALEGKSLVAPPTFLSPLQNTEQSEKDLDWNKLYGAAVGEGAVTAPVQPDQPVVEIPPMPLPPSMGRRTADDPRAQAPVRRESDGSGAKDNTIRVDTERLDQVLNLSGEIGLTKNRLTHLRADILQGRHDAGVLSALDASVSQLDMLVVNLQNAVMKTRMQPVGRLFNKYPRLARDLARQLGKDVELVLSGEETELDKTMIEDLNDPLVHLVRNAVDHGVEDAESRAAAGKPAKSQVKLGAHQEGDHILITIEDDGKGMRPETIRNKAIEKGLIGAESASGLDDEASLNLIFLPGFSTKDEISSVSGRGVGMDVVNTNIQKLKGTISITSEPGKGSKFVISLPLTLAILPVLVLRMADQSFAVPLSLVREILTISENDMKLVSGKATMVVRGEVLPVKRLSSVIGWGDLTENRVGVLMQIGGESLILSAEGFAGHEDVVIKPLDTFQPRGVSGVTMSSDGDIVLILDMKKLIEQS